MNTAFRNMLDKSRTARAKSAIRNAPEKPFPELNMDEQDKLYGMLEQLFELNGKKYSELSINEKRLVEFFCMRTLVNAEGKKPEAGQKEYRVLRMAGYAHRFAVRGLSEWFGHPSITKLSIVEDEPLNYLELYGDTSYPYSGSPYHDALRSFPDKYLPIRDSKSRAEIWAVWCGKKPSDVTTYKYKQREYTLGNEVTFRDYPIYEEKIVEETTTQPIIEVKTIYHPDVEHFIAMQKEDVIDEKVAELYAERKADLEAFNEKYNNPPAPPYSYAKKVEAYLESK